LQRKILFNTSGIPKSPESYNLEKIKIIKIQTKDGLYLLSWYYKSIKNNPLLVYFHGNSYHIGERAHRIKRYIDKDWSVILVSWRGFSGNQGKPTEKNLYIDGESTIEWIIKNTEYNVKDLVIYGESLGTGVAVELGTRYKFLSIVLEAPFTSISDLAKSRYKIYPTTGLVKDKFDNFNKIDKLLSPLLIISGKRDEIVPHKHSQILFNKAIVLKKSVFIDEAMHNNLYDFDIDREVFNFNWKLWK